MIKATVTELARQFRRYREIAQGEPIAVVSQGRPTAYLVSASEFEELQRFRAYAQQSFATVELTASEIDAVAIGRMSEEHDHLNALLDSD
jgi:prevent-host-death family protein